MQFEHLTVVCHGFDDAFHVVRTCCLVRNGFVQFRAYTVGAVRCRRDRQRGMAAVGKIRQELFDLVDTVRVIFRNHMADTAFGGVRHGSAKVFLGNFFADHSFDDFRTGDIHIGCVFHHKDPVRQRRRIHRPARCRSHDGRDLGNIT